MDASPNAPSASRIAAAAASVRRSDDCSNLHEEVHVEIGQYRMARFPQLVCFVRLDAMRGPSVFRRVDGGSRDAELVGGAERANGDFAAIGDQQLLEHGSGRSMA